MAYTKTQWSNGDVISAEKLNNIEQGIEDASGGGNTFLVTFEYVAYSNTWTCDKTNAEIYEAYSDGKDIRYNINVSDASFPLNTSGRIYGYNISESSCRTDGFYFVTNAVMQLCSIAMYNNEIEIVYCTNQDIGYILVDGTSNGNGGYIVKENLNDGVIAAAEQIYDKWEYLLQFPLQIWNSSSSYVMYIPIARKGNNIYYKGSDDNGLYSDDSSLYNEAIYKLFYSDTNNRYEVEKVAKPTT